MNLTGESVRIMVSEPWDWEGVLFGTITSYSANELVVKLTDPIQGKKLTSDLLKINPRYEKTDFQQLYENQSVTIGGALILNDSDEFDYLLIGSVTLAESGIGFSKK